MAVLLAEGRMRKASATTSLLIGLLAMTFVLTALRRQTAFIVVEPWQIVMAGCLVAWGLELVRDGQSGLDLDRVGLFALAIVVAAWLSYFGALDLATWFKRAGRITYLFGTYAFLVAHTRDARQFRTLVRYCVTASAVAALVMLFQVGQWIRAGGDLERLLGGAFTGTFVNGNQGSTYVATFAVLEFALRKHTDSDSLIIRRLDVAIVSVCILAVVVDQSRTGVLALIAGATVVLIGERRIGLWLATVASGCLLFGLLASQSPLMSRWLAMFGASGDSKLDAFVKGGTVVRSFSAQIYWEIIKARPVFGIGAANSGFMTRLNLDWPPVPAGASAGFETVDRYMGFSSHNGFLNWWAETGTVGLVPVVGSLAYGTWALWQVHRQRLLPAYVRAMALGVIAAITAFVVTNMTGDFGVSDTRFWVLLAATSIVLRLADPARPAFKLFPVESPA